MNIGTGGNMKSKAWRDIWGAVDGVGQLSDARSVAELVQRLKRESALARDDFLVRTQPASGTARNAGQNSSEAKVSRRVKSRRQAAAFAVTLSIFSMPCEAEEIRIGQTMPYSGALSGFGAIGRAEQAYFDRVNDEGGISGRKIRFISLDDAYSPPKTVEHTRKLVEQEEVLLLFGSLGTATNNAVHRYLNAKKVPQLFILSGANKWADPEHYPWTMPGTVAYRSEGAIFGKYIIRNKPDAKIAILSQNDDFGRDYLAGFKGALGESAKDKIVAEITYESTSPTIGSQLASLKASGANVVVGITLGKFTAQLVKGLAEVGWKPDLTFIPGPSSSLGFLAPAGLENAIGLLSSSNQKDPNDPQWTNSTDMQEFHDFMRQNLPNADLTNSSYAAGYIYAHLLVQVLRQCEGDFSRENIMRQAASLKNVTIPLLLPGVTINTGADDYLPFQQLKLRRFDGKSWIDFGELLDDN